jgi:hypothetical protein
MKVFGYVDSCVDLSNADEGPFLTAGGLRNNAIEEQQ